MASQGPDQDPAPPPTQSEPSQSDSSKKERVWKLKGGDMYVGSCGKKNDRDPCMTLDLVFKFDDEPSPKVVGEFHPTHVSLFNSHIFSTKKVKCLVPPSPSSPPCSSAGDRARPQV